ncbi:MAG: hypothetical protein ACFB0G_21405 [Leptolyngbyaceae cyanobacterium]
MSSFVSVETSTQQGFDDEIRKVAVIFEGRYSKFCKTSQRLAFSLEKRVIQRDCQSLRFELEPAAMLIVSLLAVVSELDWGPVATF